MTEENYKKAQELELRIVTLEHLKQKILASKEQAPIEFKVTFTRFGQTGTWHENIHSILGNEYSHDEDLDFLIEQIDNRIKRLKNEFLQL